MLYHIDIVLPGIDFLSFHLLLTFICTSSSFWFNIRFIDEKGLKYLLLFLLLLSANMMEPTFERILHSCYFKQVSH